MNEKDSNELKAQLTSLKNRTPAFYKELELDIWNDSQYWYDRWCINTLERYFENK